MKAPIPSQFANPTVRAVFRTITSHGMLDRGDRVLVAVSGGPDSMALLHILATIAPTLDLALGVAHLDHRLRKDASAADARFTEAQARAMNLPFFGGQRDVRRLARRRGLSLEEAARQARYQFLDGIAAARGYRRIALGHHGDDNAELVLMFLLRGSGSLGLSGIPPVREDRYIRPLIDVRRSDLAALLETRGIPWVTDRSNADPRMVRNRIRLRLLPDLEASYNPRTVETLNRLARILRDEEHWMDATTGPLFERARLEGGAGRLTLSATALRAMHPAAGRRVLRKALAAVKGDLRRISFRHVESALSLLVPASGDRTLHLPGGVRLRSRGDRLVLTREDGPGRPPKAAAGRGGATGFRYRQEAPGSLLVEETGARLRLSLLPRDGAALPAAGHPQTAFFDARRARFPLVLRSWRPGDRFQPLGMTGTRKVKDFFIDRKIPREARWRVPLLVAGGDIIWIAGFRTDETAKVTPATTEVLKAELLLA